MLKVSALFLSIDNKFKIMGPSLESVYRMKHGEEREPVFINHNHSVKMSALLPFLSHVDFITGLCLSLNMTPAHLSLCPKMHWPRSELNCNEGREKSLPYIYSP